jgi:glycosyltransferase involved in cell wall biosynthesis
VTSATAPAGGRPRRVLLLIPNIGPGGAETQVAHLAMGLRRRGDDVTLCCLQRAQVGAERLTAAGVRILELGAYGWAAKARATVTLARLARRADVVHCALWDASLFGRLAALATGTAVTVAEHSVSREMQVSETGQPRATWIAAHHRLLAPLTYATVMVAVAQEPLLRGEGVPADRLVHIPNGIPVDDVRAAAGGLERSDVGIPDDAAHVVIQVGRLVREKNQRATVDAVAALRAEIGDVHVIFLGEGADPAGPDRAAALDATWAHWLGARSDVPAVLALADLFVLPSVTDTMPMAVLEAMAVGLPMVAYAVGELPAVLGETGAGVTVPPGDQAAFTAACRAILVDPERSERLRRAATAGARRFDLEPMVQRYSDLFDGAIRSRAVGRSRSSRGTPFARWRRS